MPLELLQLNRSDLKSKCSIPPFHKQISYNKEREKTACNMKPNPKHTIANVSNVSELEKIMK